MFSHWGAISKLGCLQIGAKSDVAAVHRKMFDDSTL